jgi:hypothetical protein
MSAVDLTPEDLEPFATIDEAKAEAMIEDALAMAALVAPCIADDEFDAAKAAAAKAILRGAILRWHDSGSGAVSQQVVGPFQQTLDTRQTRRSLFWPTEIEQLEKLCHGENSGGAWSYDTIGCEAVVHADVCALNFGADYCSCGAVLAGSPLYECGDTS